MRHRLAAAILRSPLRWVMPSRLAVVTVDGRSVVVPHAREGDRVTLLGEQEEDWWRPLDRSVPSSVTIELDGQAHRGTARFVAGEELDAALLPYLQVNPGAWQALHVAPNAEAADVKAAARRAAVIVVDLEETSGDPSDQSDDEGDDAAEPGPSSA